MLEQHVEAVVSNHFVLNQIKEVIELRETWLRQNNLPMNCQMGDKIEQADFLLWAKKQFHTEEYQQKLQQKDFERGGNSKKQSGMHSRWSSDLQRRLGTSQLWEMVSFTGRFDASFLQPEPTADLTRQAQQARDALRWAERLESRKVAGRMQLTSQQLRILEDLDDGTLHAAANEATRKSGWGRIKHPDGTFVDIAPHNDGLVRTVLDKVVPNDESLDDMD